MSISRQKWPKFVSVPRETCLIVVDDGLSVGWKRKRTSDFVFDKGETRLPYNAYQL